MNSPLHFPDAKKMTDYLSQYPLINNEWHVEKGVTKAIIELAVARFADTANKGEMGIELGAKLLIGDLRRGKDGFTGEALPNLGKLEISPEEWNLLIEGTKYALIDCAKYSVKI